MKRSYLFFQTDASGSDDGGGTEGEGSGTPAPTPPAGDPESQADKDNESSTGDATLQAARREAAKYRTERNNLKEKVEKLEKDKLSDTEKVAKERDELKESTSELMQKNRDLRVQVLSGKAGIVDPEAASALLNWDGIKDPDDDKEIESALKALVKEKPYLSGVGGSSDGGAGDGSGGTVVNMNDLIRQKAGRG